MASVVITPYARSAASQDISAHLFDDWALWNVGSGSGTNVAPNQRKSGGGSTIGNLTCTVSTLDGFTASPVTMAWSGGTPTASGSNTNGIFNNNGASGADASLTLPADTSTREAIYYIEAYSSNVTLTCTLSDGSAGPAVDTSMTNPAGDVSTGYFIITYSAASAGQTLTVKAVGAAAPGGGGGTYADVEVRGIGWRLVGGSSIAPTGIASAEAMGAPGVQATVAPSGVASAQAMGAPSIAATLAPTGIATGQALGTPSVAGGISPTGIASAQAFGAPSVAAGISPAGIATGEAFGVPVVAAAGLFPVGIATAEALGVPALAAQVSPAGIALGQAFGVPTVGAASAPGFPGFEVDQRRPRAPRRLPERTVTPMLVRALERRLPKVAPPKERAAKRAKVIEFEAAAMLLDGATAREIAPLLQQWEAQRPYIPPKLEAVPTLDLFLSNVGFRVEQAQAQKAALDAIATARRQQEDALLALLLA